MLRCDMHARRVLAFTCLLAIVALRIEPQLLRLPFSDRTAFAAGLTRYPDRGWPQYPRFLEGVRAQTHDGDSIALIVPMMNWDGGYSYAYYRASYFLAGREVLPVLTADDQLHPENFRSARYIAAWHSRLPPGRSVVWRGEGGELLRR
jgi:hypothetical protein